MMIKRNSSERKYIYLNLFQKKNKCQIVSNFNSQNTPFQPNGTKRAKNNFTVHELIKDEWVKKKKVIRCVCGFSSTEERLLLKTGAMFGQLQILIYSLCTMVISGKTTNITAVTVFGFLVLQLFWCECKGQIIQRNYVYYLTPKILYIKTENLSLHYKNSLPPNSHRPQNAGKLKLRVTDFTLWGTPSSQP